MDFANEIKNGAKSRFEYAKAHLAELTVSQREEIRHIANELYSAGLVAQAKKFVELAYLHLHNKDMVRYTIIRKQYGGLIQ